MGIYGAGNKMAGLTERGGGKAGSAFDFPNLVAANKAYIQFEMELRGRYESYESAVTWEHLGKIASGRVGVTQRW